MTDRQKKQIAYMRSKGLPYTHIAKTLGVSVNTVKSFGRRCAPAEQEPAAAEGHCKQCGEVFSPQKHSKKRTFCSDQCRNKWWNVHRALMPHHASYLGVCACCGREFAAPKPGRKYCSHACYTAYRFKKFEGSWHETHHDAGSI